MATSYCGQYLKVNLSTGEANTFSLPAGVIRDYVGGKGIGAYLLARHASPVGDPLAPENPLLILTGPLTATGAPAIRSVAVFRSPLTGLFTDSHFGGFFGQELKQAGYDGLMITGQANTPCLIEIEDGRVEVKDAAWLWGKDTYETYDLLHECYPEKEWRLACIGPAGEHQVRFACLDLDPHRQAGRGGGGAVMGAKRLKAIVVKGSGKVEVADAEQFKGAVRAALNELKEEPTILGYSQNGTPDSMGFAQSEGLLPTLNFQFGSFQHAENLMPDVQRRIFWERNTACAGCPIACSKMGCLRKGEHAGLINDTVEYESLAMLGSNLGVAETDQVIYLAATADRLGLDTISAGAVLSFACEATERGLLETSLRFDDAHRLAEMMFAIAWKSVV